MDEIVESIEPELYRIDVNNGAIIPVDDRVYEAARVSHKQIDRQFAYLMTGPDHERIEDALRERLRAIRGWELPGPLNRKARDVPVKLSLRPPNSLPSDP